MSENFESKIHINNENKAVEGKEKEGSVGKIINWIPERGFGFVNMDGKRIFVHVNAIKPRQERGADLNGVEIVVQKIEKADKGFSALSALTVAEFEKREKDKKMEEEELVTDKKKLAEFLPKLEEKIKDKLPLRNSIFLEGGVNVKIMKGEANVLSFDSQNGAEVDFKETFLVSLGKASEVLTLSCRNKGWKDISLGWTHMSNRETGKMLVDFIVPYKGSSKIEFPASASAPYFDSERNALVQDITASTPIGIVTQKIVLYRNSAKKINYDEMWGNYDITSLVAGTNKETLTEAGILSDKPPVVKFEVKNFSIDHDTTFEYESDDGMGMRTGGHKWTTYHGGVRIEIQHPFLTQKGYAGISFDINMDQAGLNRADIENCIRKKIEETIESKHLTGYNSKEFGEKLLSQIMSEIPSFEKENDLWIIDKEFPWYQLKNIPHGYAVVLPEIKPKEDDFKDRTDSNSVIVTKREIAERLKLPGEFLTEAEVCWKNPLREVFPLEEQAEQLLIKLDFYPIPLGWGTT